MADSPQRVGSTEGAAGLLAQHVEQHGAHVLIASRSG